MHNVNPQHLGLAARQRCCRTIPQTAAVQSYGLPSTRGPFAPYQTESDGHRLQRCSLIGFGRGEIEAAVMVVRLRLRKGMAKAAQKKLDLSQEGSLEIVTAIIGLIVALWIGAKRQDLDF